MYALTENMQYVQVYTVYQTHIHTTMFTHMQLHLKYMSWNETQIVNRQ